MRGRYSKGHKRRTLVIEDPPRHRAPSLPAERDWDRRTRAWWHDLWHSPMAAEFMQADVHGLIRLAVLVDRYWVKPSPSLLAEIRLSSEAYGLTPTGRRRLGVQVERVQSGKPRPGSPASDPRDILTFPGGRGDNDA
jgi:hypothetical protein